MEKALSTTEKGIQGLDMLLPIPIPRYTSFKRWAEALLVSAPFLTLPLPPKEEEKWKQWVQQIQSLNTFTKPFPNLPPHFEGDWQEWAELFVGQVS